MCFQTLFDEPSFAQDVPLALSTAISKCEEAMLKPPHSGGLGVYLCVSSCVYVIDGCISGDRNEFSGTTFVATVVRGNQLWVRVSRLGHLPLGVVTHPPSLDV